MDKQEILNLTQAYIKKTFLDEGTGHDYFHIERVVVNAKKILETENPKFPITFEVSNFTTKELEEFSQLFQPKKERS